MGATRVKAITAGPPSGAQNSAPVIPLPEDDVLDDPSKKLLNGKAGPRCVSLFPAIPFSLSV